MSYGAAGHDVQTGQSRFDCSGAVGAAGCFMSYRVYRAQNKLQRDNQPPRLTAMVKSDDKIDRFLEQALRFQEAAESARDVDVRRVYEELAQLWRRLAEQVRALHEQID